MKMFSRLIKTTIRILAVLAMAIMVLFVLSRIFGLRTYRMQGDYSMFPTLKKGTYMVVKMDPDPRKLRRDAIVLISNRTDPGGYYWTKRIIAVPGDTLQITDDEVFVNHVFVEEPYAYFQSEKMQNHIEMVLPDEAYFVMGDNRHNSMDSRDPEFGLVRQDKIRGLMLIKFAL